MVDYKDQMRQSTEYATEHLWNAHQEFDFGVSGQTGLYRETLTWKQNKTQKQKTKKEKKKKNFILGLEMAQPLRALAILAEDPGWVLKGNMTVYNPLCNSSSMGSSALAPWAKSYS